MGKLLPVLFAIVGLAGGVGAGLALRAPPEEIVDSVPCDDIDTDVTHAKTTPAIVDKDAVLDYVKLSNQFVIPVVKEGKVTALVVMSLSVEVTSGGQELIYEREPKLRDAFLQVLFDHANAGGFDGTFTNGRNMTILRDSLKEIAVTTLGSVITDVLVIDVVRQDI